MKYLLCVFVLFLSSCSNLSENENDINIGIKEIASSTNTHQTLVFEVKNNSNDIYYYNNYSEYIIIFSKKFFNNGNWGTEVSLWRGSESGQFTLEAGESLTFSANVEKIHSPLKFGLSLYKYEGDQYKSTTVWSKAMHLE